MNFGVEDSIAARVVAEETLGLAPDDETRLVPMAFRLQVRAEVEAIKEAGGEVEVPNAVASTDDAELV